MLLEAFQCAWEHKVYALGEEDYPFDWQGQYKGHVDGCTHVHT